MQVYFETVIHGEEVKIGVSFWRENEPRIYVILDDKQMIRLYDYTDNIDDIERVTEQSLDEYVNRYERC